MKLALVAVLLAVASDARADRLACETTSDVAKRHTTIKANNAKARDAALAAAGLALVAAPIAARGAQSKQPAGNLVWIKIRVGCETDVASEVVFAVDKAGKAYRVKPKTTYVEVPILRCGGPECEPLCGMPPVEESYAFKLPDKVVYSGERDVGWKVEIARVTYDQPGVCGKNGQVMPAPKPDPSAAPVGELERLRAENAQLRKENAALKKQLQSPAARRAAENKQLEDEKRKLSRGLKE